VLKKSGPIHKTIGKIYVFAWLILLITGAHLGGLIITTIGIFGFYFALTGSRIGHLKNKPITLFEKSVFVMGGLVSLSMLYFSASLYFKGQNSFAMIFAIFGTIFLFTTANDISKYIFAKPLKKQPYGDLDWYFEHFKRMCISFIAAVTAFASIQNVFGENTLNFIVPTVLGTVMINLAAKSFKKKFVK